MNYKREIQQNKGVSKKLKSKKRNNKQRETDTKRKKGKDNNIEKGKGQIWIFICTKNDKYQIKKKRETMRKSCKIFLGGPLTKRNSIYEELYPKSNIKLTQAWKLNLFGKMVIPSEIAHFWSTKNVLSKFLV